MKILIFILSIQLVLSAPIDYDFTTLPLPASLINSESFVTTNLGL